jgi:hypothetical protein
MEVDKNKLKELTQILTLIEKDKNTLPKLLEFEKENISILYYTELLTTKSLKNVKISCIILMRMKEINFFNQDEYFIRKMAKFISSSDCSDYPFFIVQSTKVLHNYFSIFKENTRLYLLLFEEIATFSNMFEYLMELVELLVFDSILFKFFKETLQSVPQETTTNTPNLTISICLKILLKLEKAGEDLNPFYPDIRSLILESELSIHCIEIFNIMMDHIPIEDFTILIQKFEGIFNSSESIAFLNYFLKTFEKENFMHKGLISM